MRANVISKCDNLLDKSFDRIIKISHCKIVHRSDIINPFFHSLTINYLPASSHTQQMKYTSYTQLQLESINCAILRRVMHLNGQSKVSN